MNKAVPVTAINSYYDPETGKFLLLQGDENGEVVVYDISVILRKRSDLKPVDITKGNQKRNPHREFKFRGLEEKHAKKGGNDSEEDEEGKNTIVPLVPENEIVKIFTNDKKHNDVIRSIQYISVSDEPLIMTASYDKNVHLINMNKEIVGTLKQGYKTLAKYKWDFKCSKFLKDHPERVTKMEREIEKMRKIRDKGMSTRK
jgi:WD40 repeat protein